MNAHATRLRARGFSLIEVMVAVIVICIGVLGIAKMQALALSNTNTSRLRSLAAIEAASLAASMHSNRNFWGAATANYTVTPTAITSAGDAGTAAIATGQLAAPVLCENAFCQPQNMAGVRPGQVGAVPRRRAAEPDGDHHLHERPGCPRAAELHGRDHLE